MALQPAGAWLCLNLMLQLLSAVSAVEVSGTIHFQMTWDEIDDTMNHQVYVNGKSAHLSSLEQSVSEQVTETNSSVRQARGRYMDSRKQKELPVIPLGHEFHKQARRQRRSTHAATSPQDDSYARHGPECVKKQNLLAKYIRGKVDSGAPHRIGFGTAQEVIDDIDVLKSGPAGAKTQTEAPVQPAVPGIPEAPGVFAKEQADEQSKKEETDTSKSSVHAVDVGENGRVKEKREGLHIAVLVEVGEEARLACHYCYGPEDNDKSGTKEDKDKTKKPMVWYHLSSKKHFGSYKIKEVDLDMHDDPKLNRVYVTDTHTLVMREVKVKQHGTYFCRDTTDPKDGVPKKLSEQDLGKFFKRDDLLRFLYHLDVLAISQVEAKLVRSSSEEDNAGLPLPAPPGNVTGLDARVISSWQAWSLCSSCGETPGTRRRLGQCTVKRHAKRDSPPARASYLGIILSLYRDGIPCRSSLLQGHKDLREHITRPDEVQEEECQVSCANYSVKMADILVRDALQVKQLDETVFLEQEGHSLTIKCPQAPLDFPVAWVNGTKILIGPLLHRITNGRVRVDERNNLHIKKLLPADDGYYACVFTGRVRARMRLKVKPLPKRCKYCLYSYYLTLTFIFDFLVYSFMAMVRHRAHRQNLNYDLLGVGWGSSDSDSSDESSSSSGGGGSGSGSGGGEDDDDGDAKEKKEGGEDGEEETDEEGGDTSANAWRKTKSAGAGRDNTAFRTDNFFNGNQRSFIAGDFSNSCINVERASGTLPGFPLPSTPRTDGGDCYSSSVLRSSRGVGGRSAFVRYQSENIHRNNRRYRSAFASGSANNNNDNNNNNNDDDNSNNNSSNNNNNNNSSKNDNKNIAIGTSSKIALGKSKNKRTKKTDESRKNNDDHIENHNCIDQEAGFAFPAEIAQRNAASDYITSVMMNNVIGNEGTPGKRFWMRRV